MSYSSTLLNGVRIPALLLVALAGTGCAVDKAGCDPAQTRTAGFLTKLSCDFSGSYEARAEDKRQETARLESQRENIQQEINTLKSQSQQLSEQVLRSRAQRDRAINSLNKSLESLKASAAADAQVRQQIIDTQQQLEALSNSADSLDTAELEARASALRAEIDGLTNQIVENFN